MWLGNLEFYFAAYLAVWIIILSSYSVIIITFYYNLYVKSAGGNEMKTYSTFSSVHAVRMCV